MKLELIIPDLDTFYRESYNLEDTGNASMHQEQKNKDRPSFVGMPLKDIPKYKYTYSKGLDDLKEIEAEFVLSGAKNIKKFDAMDGDEMNMDRFVEDLPYLEKRIKTNGDKSGRFINIYVNICESYGVSYNNMLHKTYCTIQLCDYLESLGYRTNIYSRVTVKNLGYYKGELLDYLSGNVLIKSSDQPLIKPLLLTTISPWFFRHWWFCFWTAKFNTTWGLGQVSDEQEKSTKSDVYINSGECLNPESVNKKLTEIKNLFEV